MLVENCANAVSVFIVEDIIGNNSMYIIIN